LLAALIPLLDGVAHTEEFLRDPRVRPGDRITRPGAAAALDAIVEGGRDGFYGGPFGEGLLALGGGEYVPSDLERVQADWVDPLRVGVWDHEVWTIPPNSQGYLTLAGAHVAARLDATDPDRDLWAHLLVEAAKAVAHDRPSVLHEGANGNALLSPERLEHAATSVDPERASVLQPPVGAGDTMFLCVVDADRMGVSLIQSNASGFGAGIFEPATRISLHNRGIGFSLEAGHPAEYGPGRRPPSTLSPALVTRRDGSLRGPVGTMGGDTQPQIVLQILSRWLGDGEAPGKAIGAPRWGLARRGGHGFDTWRADGELVVRVERDGPDHWIAGLEARGHQVEVIDELNPGMGHAHLIEVREDGTLAGAADPRAVVGSAQGY
jgi:gamma-glutamyltranspeptidase/glutathione hydrolase